MVELSLEHRVMFDNISLGAFYQRADGSIADVNQAALDIVGLDRDQFVDWFSKDTTGHFLGEDRSEFPIDQFPSFVALRSAEAIRESVAGIFNRNRNCLVWVSISAIPLFQQGAEIPYRVFVTLEDLSGPQRNSEAPSHCEILNQFSQTSLPVELLPHTTHCERRYRAIVENQTEFVNRYRPGGTLSYVNLSLCQYLGMTSEELLGQSFYPFVHEDDRHQLVDFIESLDAEHPVITLDYRMLLSDSRVCWHQWTHRAIFNPSGTLIEYQSVGRDITDVKRAEEERLGIEKQLLQGQKLESLGLLAGGIAHDFNNILTGILGCSSLGLMYTEPDSPVAANFRMIEKAATRAADLTRQMLAFSGKGRFQIETIDLNQLLQDMSPLLVTSALQKASFSFELDPNIPAIEADASQMRQVVMNLVVNASEAIGEKGGDIVIRSYSKVCDSGDAKDAWICENVGKGRYVVLEIADTGCGMDQETMGRIFDPFFTTKFTGRGLGLSAVLGIIKGQQGSIKIKSEPGSGTVFSLLLPASDKTPLSVLSLDKQSDWHGSGTVLLVDDEAAVRSVGRDMLRVLGFQVLTAKDGLQAIELYRAHCGMIRFVLLDLTMPQLDGEQTFRELKRIDPGAQVIISSGFSEIDVTQRFADAELLGFIQKPYRLSELREALRGMLPKSAAA
jgi:two-component system, cell cycle sensor histidine kinase and response regulator CckA